MLRKIFRQRQLIVQRVQRELRVFLVVRQRFACRRYRHVEARHARAYSRERPRARVVRLR